VLVLVVWVPWWNTLGYSGSLHASEELNPHAGLRFLGKSFFETFANWPWPTHVVLQGEMMRFRKMGMTECLRCPLDCPAAHMNTVILILHEALSRE